MIVRKLGGVPQALEPLADQGKVGYLEEVATKVSMKYSLMIVARPLVSLIRIPMKACIQD